MSALTRARTWSTNRHDQEQARAADAAARHVSSSSATTSATTTTTRFNTEYVAVARGDGRLPYKDNTTTCDGPEPEAEPVAHPTFLQPRVAAVLGVSEWWHPVLFSLRLLSILPSIYLCFPVAIRFLLKLHSFAISDGEVDGAGAAHGRPPAEDRLLLTETMLAIVWCGCSGYLSFFFTDCLMSRW